MVVAQQAQHRMYRQIRDLTLQRMAVQLGLLHGALHRDDDVAQQLAAVVLVNVILAVFTEREAQNVGGGVLVAVLLVQLVDAVVIHEGHADLRRTVKMLEIQHRVAAAADQDAQPGRDLDHVLIVRNQHLIGHVNRPPLFVYGCGCREPSPRRPFHTLLQSAAPGGGARHPSQSGEPARCPRRPAGHAGHQ